MNLLQVQITNTENLVTSNSFKDTILLRVQPKFPNPKKGIVKVCLVLIKFEEKEIKRKIEGNYFKIHKINRMICLNFFIILIFITISFINLVI